MVTQYHYNPKSYLKAFAVPDGTLFRYSKHLNKFIPSNGSKYTSYGSKRNLYLESFEIKYLSRIDSNFVKIRNRLTNHIIKSKKQTFTQLDFTHLANFISLQPFRTPVSKELLELAYKRYPPRSGRLSKNDIRVKFSIMIRNKSSEVIHKLTYSKLMICISPLKTPFITSDNVVTLFRSKSKQFLSYSDAYLDPTTHILFPLSSRLCIWAGDIKPKNSEIDLVRWDITPKRTKYMNAMILAHATEYAYCNNRYILEKAIKKGSKMEKCKLDF